MTTNDDNELICHLCGEKVNRLVRYMGTMWLCPECNEKCIEAYYEIPMSLSNTVRGDDDGRREGEEA